MSALADYLAKLDCRIVADGKLSIGRHAFDAVHYVQNGQDRIYVVGELPPVLRRKRKMALRVNDGARDWYVAGHASAATACSDKFAKWHPFGADFILALWDIAEPIDKYNYWRGEHKPYLRIAAQLV